MKGNAIFFDVDTQYDFLDKTGKLYVKGAQKIVSNLKRLTDFASVNRIPIFASADKHIKNDPEFKIFPVHCVAGTKGQKKIKQTLLEGTITISSRKYTKDKLAGALKTKQVIIEKNTYDAFSNPNLKILLGNVKTSYVYGVATDYCVKSACLGLRKNGIKTYLITDAIRAVNSKSGKEALKLLKKSGVIFIRTNKVSAGGIRWSVLL